MTLLELLVLSAKPLGAYFLGAACSGAGVALVSRSYWLRRVELVRENARREADVARVFFESQANLYREQAQAQVDALERNGLTEAAPREVWTELRRRWGKSISDDTAPHDVRELIETMKKMNHE